MKIELSWDKIPSVNNMYIRTKWGVALSKQAREFKDSIMSQLNTQILNEGDCSPELCKDDVLTLNSKFTLNSRFFVMDLDNMLKLTIDAIFKVLDLNDSRIIEIETSKYFSKGSKESIVIELTKSQLNYIK